MKFTKMHGLGNDFVMVDCLAGPVPESLPELGRAVCDRHFGVGADGLILALPSDKADVRMQIINSDGSEAENCGNAIRCLAKLMYDRGHVRGKELSIETVGRVNPLQVVTKDGAVEAVRVDMGEPSLRRETLPLAGEPGTQAVDEPLEVEGTVYRITGVSMGNPHAVTFLDDVESLPLAELGPRFEHHPSFPRRTNTEFIQVLGPEELRMRVWERGAGETLACGTGACASLVAGVLTGRTSRRAVIHLNGGDLLIEWGDDNHVYMTGPAVEVFEGVWL